MNDRDRNPNEPADREPFFMRKPGTGPHPSATPAPAAKADDDKKGKPEGGDASCCADKNGGDKSGGPKKEGDDKKPPVYRYEPDPDAPLRPHRSSPRAELLIKSPRVLITPDAYKRMCLYIEIAPKEVGWLGTVKRLGNGDFLIEEVFLVEQEVTGVETELSVEGREKLVLELLEGGDAGLDKSNTLHFWGHSHVRMSTGPSGTDENTMVQFGTEGHPYYIRGIFTKLGRGEFTLYLYDKGYRVLDAPWAVWDPTTREVILEPKAFPSYSWGGNRSWERQDQGDGGSIFGFRREEPIVVSKDKPLPPQLVADETLRAAVTTEYNAKVSERRVFFKWFRKDDDERPEGQVADGDCIPTGFDTGDGAPPNVGGSTPSVIRKEQPRQAAQPSGNGGGFLDWFFGLFSGPSQPTTPASRPAAPPTSPASKGAPSGAPNPGNTGAPPAPPTGDKTGGPNPSDKSGK